MDGLMPCGTRAAYRRHLRHREPTCDACRAAKAEWDRSYRRGARPTETQAERQKQIRLARIEDYYWLLETGCRHPEMIAKRLRFNSVNSLERFIFRNGLPWVGTREAA